MLHPNELIMVPVNVEAKIIAYLREELSKHNLPYTENIHVSLKPPRTRPETPKNLVTVMASGGDELSRSRFQTGLVVTSYADTNSHTWNLASLVRGLLRRMPLKDADITNIEAVGQPIIVNDLESDEMPERFQNFIVQARIEEF